MNTSFWVGSLGTDIGKYGRGIEHNLFVELRELIVSFSLRLDHSETFRNRSALAITETELKLIAALANIGLNNHPNTG